MAIEREIEFKQLLDFSSYKSIKATYFKEAIPFTQINYYIDTPDFQIQSQKMALRIREKSNHSLEMTLKVPDTIGLNEYNFDTHISPKSNQYIEVSQIPEAIQKVLIEKNVAVQKLQVLGDLKTHRFEKHINDGLLVLDHSCYLGKEDYELEFEVTDYEQGKKSFETLLSQFDLTHTEPKNKVRRFFEYQATLNYNDKE
ncbi:CYTH domain-containing protein [Staphylococcus ratti]|uniref:CYTH domain-containing protein n=1 Tax=Staphylococcus ratti TaxID=2892440 RepID=A0ABY3PB86_9STAP|nr:CYTH domain-containing protein [Staphylococcus ratti]UEX89559.1 CYTH domain-containing protein [Staphylococcus ratti]